MVKKVTISDIPMQKSRNPQVIINWFLESLGIITRDFHGDIFTNIMLLFMEKAQGDKQDPISIDNIMNRTKLKRSTAYKYIGRLMDAGLVKKVASNQYVLADGQLSIIVEDIKKDVIKILDKIKDRAAQLDKESIFLE